MNEMVWMDAPPPAYRGKREGYLMVDGRRVLAVGRGSACMVFDGLCEDGVGQFRCLLKEGRPRRGRPDKVGISAIGKAMVAARWRRDA